MDVLSSAPCQHLSQGAEEPSACRKSGHPGGHSGLHLLPHGFQFALKLQGSHFLVLGSFLIFKMIQDSNELFFVWTTSVFFPFEPEQVSNIYLLILKKTKPLHINIKNTFL